GHALSAARIELWGHLMEEAGGVVVTTIDALMAQLDTPEEFRASVFTIDESDRLDPQKFAEKLTALGYERTAEVDGIGQFSIRGGIIDFFPVTEELPVRIELWDTDIDSIRSFDPESQRSVERLQTVTVYPARERELGGSASFLRYFDLRDTLIFFDEPVRCEERARNIEQEFREGMAGRLASGQLTEAEIPQLVSAEEILEELKTEVTLCLSGLDARFPEYGIREYFSLGAKTVASFPGSFELLIADMKRYEQEKWRVVLLTPSRPRAGRLAQSFREYGLSAFCPDAPDGGDAALPEAVRGSIMVMHGNLHRGFEYPLLQFALLSESDLFGKTKRKSRKKKYTEGSRISSLSELSIGDYVVHEDYGLGIYQGIEKIEADGVVRDYIKIQYRGGDNCYVPATKLDAIQKYAAGDAPAPKLNRLGGPEWGKTKAKVKGAVKQIAKELVELYASRMKQRGHSYGPDTVWQQEFEELFPYEETEDQKKAIADVKRDMESGQVMDRLICGDVGYGKTE
ncbi:MAG: CarD family transcriptional regulator, partial [Lachnospiraceae bacterium]